MRYNGMGNRFSTMPRYHAIIKAHAIIAVIAFLVLLPFSVMFARFYSKVPGRGVRMHIYLNILVLGLATVVFILGFMAVGPERSLTNPHHGIGVAIYVMLIWQTIVGNWIRKKFKKKGYRRPPIKLMLHQWVGRAAAILGVVQVPLGLVLYGSPKWTFVLYSIWMTFLLLFYFINQYKSYKYMDDGYGGRDGIVIEEKEKKSGGLGKLVAPLLAGAGAVFLAKKVKGDKHDDRHTDVISSRHGSRRGSHSSFTEESIEERREKKSGGFMSKLMTGAAIGAAGIFASKYLNKKKDRDVEASEYTSVTQDTPHRRPSKHPRPAYSDYTTTTEDSLDAEARRDARRGQNLLPAAGGAAAAAAAISAAERPDRRPRTPPPAKSPKTRITRKDSYDSYSDSNSPSRRVEKSNTGRNAVIGALGLGWLGKKLNDRKNERDRIRDEELRRREEEDRRRYGGGRRYTGDGHRPRRDDMTEYTESDFTSDYTSVHPRPGTATTATGVTGGPMPPLNAGRPGQSGRIHEIVEPIPMPSGPPRDSYQEHLDDSLLSRRRSSRDRRAAEAAAATAGAALAEAEAERRRRSREGSRYRSRSGSRPAAAVKVRVGDQDVTVQRLTKEQTAERERMRRNSLSDSEVTSARSGRYRRDHSTRRDYSAGPSSRSESASRDAAARLDERRARAAEQARADEAAQKEMAHMQQFEPLSPPRPAFAGGRVKDSAYYSGQPAGGVAIMSGESLGETGSRGTWSAASPSVQMGGAEEAAERRRRRRAERQAGSRGGGSVGV